MVGEHLWEHLDADDMPPFAGRWLAGDAEAAQSVVLLGFTAPAELQWAFIVAAVEQATSDGQLGLIAAGPAECLLSRKGAEAIGWFERRASADKQFARMLTGARRHLMSDAIWRRVCALQSAVDDPLP